MLFVPVAPRSSLDSQTEEDEKRFAIQEEALRSCRERYKTPFASVGMLKGLVPSPDLQVRNTNFSFVA